MIVDIATVDELKHFNSLPLPGSNVVKKYKVGDDIQILFQKQPLSISGDDLIYIHYSLLALYQNEVKFVVSIEALDLRSLSVSLSVSLKELRNEYHTKGFLAPCKTMIYSSDIQEEFESYDDKLSDEVVLPYLIDILLDSLDIEDELIIIN